MRQGKRERYIRKREDSPKSVLTLTQTSEVLQPTTVKNVRALVEWAVEDGNDRAGREEMGPLTKEHDRVTGRKANLI